MDRNTLEAYDKAARTYADDWHAQPPPLDLQALIGAFFSKSRTADIGCGSGREVAWLNANGYPAIGFDASDGLLAEARRRYPEADFRRATLPALDGIPSASFDNVLCETVIMHLPRADIVPSVRRLIDIVKCGGVLYVSWRVTKETDQRDKNGRLYSSFGPELIRSSLENAVIVADEEVVSASSGKAIHWIVARKS
ncbi:MAG: class I SAM-dependent methyltransferase [Pseudolabrys sp.]|nr:class I SAM-dependent methyltransferase [Pseudolabrys sp.]